MNQATARVLHDQVQPGNTKKPGQLYVIRRRRVSRRRHRQLAFGALLLLCCGVLIAVQYSSLAHAGKNVQELRKSLEKEQKAIDYLHVEINQLQSLERIEQVATTRLGMHHVQQARSVPMQPRVTIPTLAGTTVTAPVMEESQPPVVGAHPMVASVTRFFSQVGAWFQQDPS
ncbi:cell division protein FtsL [Heliophilum fasciatum]|uniref:Cell division protein FtsL n=1 Tax=Heliophilum fasciatum TaxID=35700 RepID=A0A4R2RHM8_9FIRM|nr:cell division protein FtsL [Heliophilum fasciatum]MCW2278850.1 cell division protein FtsL [Heliophilum fasciatum]TCP62138.1 cell division protein FtsL [Heliophilum fasciatum]